MVKVDGNVEMNNEISSNTANVETRGRLWKHVEDYGNTRKTMEMRGRA